MILHGLSWAASLGTVGTEHALDASGQNSYTGSGQAAVALAAALKGARAFGSDLSAAGFGGVKGIAAWFALGPHYQYLANRVTSHYREEGRYPEDTAMAAFAAGEALDRAETATINSTARTRWKRLASKIGEFAVDFALPDLESWAHEVATEWDRLAHLLGYQTAEIDSHRMGLI